MSWDPFTIFKKGKFEVYKIDISANQDTVIRPIVPAQSSIIKGLIKPDNKEKPKKRMK